MANGRYSQSRSPIRAIAAASHTAARRAAQQPGSWGDFFRHEGERDRAPGPDDYRELQRHALACPECGKGLRLQLQANETVHHVAPSIAPATFQDPLEHFDDAVNAYKRELLTRALKENGGVMTRAAKAIGLKYTTFVAMAHRLGISKDGARGDGAGDFGV